jgi:hypothetical protein
VQKAPDPGWSNCIFCGQPIGKSARSREHVIPMWMLRATGDPNRRIKIETDPISGVDIIRPASTFHFPACRPCNESYGKKLEAEAKKAMEALFSGRSLQVSQCYRLLDWLDKVRVGLWLAFNTLHKEFFKPNFRIDQRLGTKDRIAMISVDPDDRTQGFNFGGMDNNVFRTTQAGMYLRINNVRIISMSFDGFISRFTGMPHADEMYYVGGDLGTVGADVRGGDYVLSQDWREFDIPGATFIAQTVFWPGEALAYDDRWRTYFNTSTVGRLKNKPRITRPAHLNRFYQTQLVSNAEGGVRYYPNPRKRLKIGKAIANDDPNFMKVIYILYMKYIIALGPTKVLRDDGERKETIFLSFLWVQKSLQLLFRLRDLGLQERSTVDFMIDEMQKVSRAFEESSANGQGTCVSEYSRLIGC